MPVVESAHGESSAGISGNGDFLGVFSVLRSRTMVSFPTSESEDELAGSDVGGEWVPFVFTPLKACVGVVLSERLGTSVFNRPFSSSITRIAPFSASLSSRATRSSSSISAHLIRSIATILFAYGLH